MHVEVWTTCTRPQRYAHKHDIGICGWSCRRFTYGNLVATSPFCKWWGSLHFERHVLQSWTHESLTDSLHWWRAVYTKGRDAISTSWWLALTRNSPLKRDNCSRLWLHDAPCRPPNHFRQGFKLVEGMSVARVQRTTSKGITDRASSFFAWGMGAFSARTRTRKKLVFQNVFSQCAPVWFLFACGMWVSALWRTGFFPMRSRSGFFSAREWVLHCARAQWAPQRSAHCAQWFFSSCGRGVWFFPVRNRAPHCAYPRRSWDEPLSSRGILRRRAPHRSFPREIGYRQPSSGPSLRTHPPQHRPTFRSLFSCSRPKVHYLIFLWASSRRISMVFEVLAPSKMHVSRSLCHHVRDSARSGLHARMVSTMSAHKQNTRKNLSFSRDAGAQKGTQTKWESCSSLDGWHVPTNASMQSCGGSCVRCMQWSVVVRRAVLRCAVDCSVILKGK